MTESTFILRVVFHKDITEKDKLSFFRSFKKDFGNVVKEMSSWTWRTYDFDCSIRLAYKDTKCECSKNFRWTLIGYFVERWQEVKSVETEIDGKITKIFPLDVGTCS